MAKFTKAAKQTGIKQIAIGGGVSANSGLQKAVYDEGARLGWEVFIPRLGFSLDNAGMVAVTDITNTWYHSLSAWKPGRCPHEFEKNLEFKV